MEDDNGFGFVDTDNNPVIPAQFVWAGDFREGRAEVQTQTGMGLIDRRGCYVIPPEYEIVDYDPAASVVHVRNNRSEEHTSELQPPHGVPDGSPGALRA